MSKQMPTIAVDGERPSPAPTDPEVAAKARRRTFMAAYKLAVLDELDRAKSGEAGAILRREGLYSSSLVKWRQQRAQGLLRPQNPVRRSPPAAAKPADGAEVNRLRRDADLLPEVRRVHEEKFQVYGVRKVWRQM